MSTWKWLSKGDGKFSEKKVRNRINKEVTITSKILVLKPKFADAKTLGIIKKITNGFTIPPVK